MPPSTQARKRGRSRASPSFRGRKRQKRLDAIVDRAPATPPSAADTLRRSSRARRAPEVLDSSPVPSCRTRRGGTARKFKKGERGVMSKDGLKELALGVSEVEIRDSEPVSRVWSARLRSRAGLKLELGENSERNDDNGEPGLRASGSTRRRRRRRRRKKRKMVSGDEDNQVDIFFIKNDEDDGGEKEESKPEVEIEAIPDLPMAIEPEAVEPDNNLPEVVEQDDTGEEAGFAGQEDLQEAEADQLIVEEHSDNAIADVHVDAKTGDDDFSSKMLESEDIHLMRICSKKVILKPPDDIVDVPRVKEGRRCGLCGGGIDGRPPKKLVRESTDSDNEAYEGSSVSEEPNYDIWDGFGDEPGWLGRLLGPIHDRFGIARVWVHQHCAVWSPEVYFAGLGCLKNVRAALCRGRALKCSRCGRPGATIGCRVDRCPKTYHLVVRADGCIFDHRKFLIACPDHRHFFHPQGGDYAQQIRKMKIKKFKMDLRKLSNDAMWKDLESEEKWLENRGEDEEFLKRESKRLHRDLVRIAPVYIGGSSENKLYQGWESVAGLQDVIQCMKEIVMIPLLYPEFFSNLALTPPRGVLLHGYPGTGKTLVVRSLIGACSRGDKRIAYFARKGADCLGKYVGDAERQLRLLFQVAERSQPSIIFFDEIDGLAPCRSRTQDQTHCSVVSTLLSLMDGLKSRGSVIVIGATNRPDAVDPALRRPGRFDREIYFPLPSLKDRSAILSLHTQSWPNPLSEPLLSWISSQTAGYAGADLQSLCTQAAINALKRNCALQELLSSVEKESGQGMLPSLPSFVVEERDWIAALSFAPPPCSRREAGMAANDVVSSSLYGHLVPCLLEPLCHLLILLGIDDRIWLPPSLSRASKSVKNIIFSSLLEKGISTNLWLSHLHHLIQEIDTSKEIEKRLSLFGLLVDQSGIMTSYTTDDYDNNHDEFGCGKPMEKYLSKWHNTSGFRALIAGTPRSGQHHLASCLLHTFVGHIEIQKVNLATILQEGHGDIIRGLTQILTKCLLIGRCIIYMPRIDLWALNENHVIKAEEEEHSPKSSEFSSPGIQNMTKQASEAWNSFIEQVGSMCAFTNIIILATCDVRDDELPNRVRQFFSSDVSHDHDYLPSDAIPRFFVHVDGIYNHELVLDSSAAKVSQDLVQQYVQLVHYKSHMINNTSSGDLSPTAVVSLDGQRESMENNKTTRVNAASTHLEQRASNDQTSFWDSQIHQGLNNDQRQSPLSNIRSSAENDVQHQRPEELFQKTLPIRFMKGGPPSAITMFGYQILRCPQFAELCWVTSKLKDGPCADINGPWKGWPFNSCEIHPSSSPSKVVAGGNSANLKERDSGLVRGLVAVGLLAIKGAYSSVREVSAEVRKVLELLVGRIHDKVLDGKERYRYFRLLSQVAYLEDMVNSWAYTIISSQPDNLLATSNTKPSAFEEQLKDDNAGGSALIGNNSRMPGVPKENCNMVQDRSDNGSPHKFATSNGDSVNFNEGCNLSIPDSNASIPEIRHFQQPSPLPPPSSNLHPSSSLADGALVSEDGNCISGLTPCEEEGHVKGPFSTELVQTNIPTEGSLPNLDNSSLVAESSCRDISDKRNDLSSVPSSDNASFVSDEAVTATGFTLRKNNNLSGTEISCVYDCCSQCVRTLNELLHTILSDWWRSTGSHSAVEDIHDAVVSCSLNLLRAIKNYDNSSNSIDAEEHHQRGQVWRNALEHCTCHQISNNQLKRMPFQHNSLSKVEFSPTECNCHRKDDVDKAKFERQQRYQSPCRFFFKGGVLVPANPPDSIVFHCRYEKLCVCFITEIVSMVKQPIV
ncbi:uncharacterized protein LOC120256063 [Dioscorea cayenensis subsp. rotundata]|uniref:Uncharacterized protein LOC120256063 n=1 Tax=Dioscorea cayennensis subsp. rotundata TaxID=55577 RepID=A0AB40AXH5_DIOCR|nr:uncharacterized protein LOC120256063 [Dioscorea cayenensis subsp. rotundata]